MNNFWGLVGFEYKKIFTKKFLIAFILMLVFVSFSSLGQVIGNEYFEGEIVRTKHEDFMIDKQYSLSLNGKEINSDLLKEVRDSISNYLNEVTLENEFLLSEKYIKPYNDIIGIMENFYAADGLKELALLSNEQLEDFENVRLERLNEYINGLPINDNSAKIFDENILEITNNPLIYGYPDSYILIMVSMYAICLLLCFSISISLSGIFSKDYQNKVVSLQLTSKNGKLTLYLVKIFTALSSFMLITLSFFAVNILTCLFVYGFEGFDTRFQVQLDFSPYNINLLQAIIIYFIVAFCACLFFSAMIIALSAFFKSPFVVLAISVVISLVPIFIHIPETLPDVYRIFNLFFPVANFEWYTVFSVILYEFSSFSVVPFVFVPIFHVISSVILLVGSYYIYKRHQVS